MNHYYRVGGLKVVEKSAFIEPENPNIHIWRYMNFTKYVSMLQNNGLYFSRSDNLGDDFEGVYPHGTEQARRGTRELIGESFGKLSVAFLEQRDKDSDRALMEISQKYVMVSCWHMSEHESSAMWKIYGQSNEAVAIRSRYSTLRSCLDSSVDISVINYIDEDKFVSQFSGTPAQRIFIPFVHKRMYFSYEQELRAIFSVLSNDERIDLVKNSNLKITTVSPDQGAWKRVDLNELIDAVFVAPTAPAWFKELVHKVNEKFDLNKIPIQSSLDKKPYN